MARPRSIARTFSAYDSPPGVQLPPAVSELLESEDPALPQITARVLEARMSGADTTDPLVLDACIAQGRVDHAAAQLGGAA